MSESLADRLEAFVRDAGKLDGFAHRKVVETIGGCVCRNIEQIAAALREKEGRGSPSGESVDWQPIETAPKDETDDEGNAVPVILGWWSLEAVPTWQWVLAEWNGEEWEGVGEPPYCEISHCTPSHWMRPAPPATTPMERSPVVTDPSNEEVVVPDNASLRERVRVLEGALKECADDGKCAGGIQRNA